MPIYLTLIEAGIRLGQAGGRLAVSWMTEACGHHSQQSAERAEAGEVVHGTFSGAHGGR